MADTTTQQTLDEILNSCQAATQGTYEKASETWADLPIGKVSFLVEKQEFGTFNDKTGTTFGKLNLFGPAATGNEFIQDASGKNITHRMTLWGNNYRAMSALKQLCSLVSGGDAPINYGECVRAVMPEAACGKVFVVEHVSKNGFDEYKFLSLAGEAG